MAEIEYLLFSKPLWSNWTWACLLETPGADVFGDDFLLQKETS